MRKIIALIFVILFCFSVLTGCEQKEEVSRDVIDCRFKIDNYKTIHNVCPLVAIPTPHGRLIDADRLLAIIKSAAGNQLSVPLSAVIGSIEHAPTVIEAEE